MKIVNRAPNKLVCSLNKNFDNGIKDKNKYRRCARQGSCNTNLDVSYPILKLHNKTRQIHTNSTINSDNSQTYQQGLRTRKASRLIKVLFNAS